MYLEVADTLKSYFLSASTRYKVTVLCRLRIGPSRGQGKRLVLQMRVNVNTKGQYITYSQKRAHHSVK